LITSISHPNTPVAQIANLYNRDTIATAIERTKRLYQEEIDHLAIECAEDEGMIVLESLTSSKQYTGKLPHGSA